MIKFRAEHRVFLGFSEGNLERLKQGEPIRIDRNECQALGLGDSLPGGAPGAIELVIFTGESEVAMTRELEDRGLIPPGATEQTEEVIRQAEDRRRQADDENDPAPDP